MCIRHCYLCPSGRNWRFWDSLILIINCLILLFRDSGRPGRLQLFYKWEAGYSEGLLYLGGPPCPHCRVLLCHETSRSYLWGPGRPGGFPSGSVAKNLAASAGDACLIPGLGRRLPWRRKWQPIPVFLPGESQRQRSLAGYTHTRTHSILKISDFGTTLSAPFLGHDSSLKISLLFLKATGCVCVCVEGREDGGRAVNTAGDSR